MTEIGSSDAPAILGVDAYGVTPWQWWARALGLLPPIDETAEMRWGIAIQRALIAWACEQLRIAVLASDATRYASARTWMRATPDALSADGRVVIEAKKCFAPPEEPELHWLVQVQHQLAVIGAERGVIVAGGGRAPRLYEIEAHQRFQTAMISREEAMLRAVETRTPPPVEADDNAWLARVYPEAVGAAPIALPAAAVEWDQQRERGRALMEAGQRLRDEAEARIKAALGANAAGRLATGTLYRWGWMRRSAYHVPAKTIRVLRRWGGRA